MVILITNIEVKKSVHHKLMLNSEKKIVKNEKKVS